MTTLIAIRQPLELLSMSEKPARRPKRLPAADYEQDDDFHFVRKSKKTKTEPAPEPEPEPESEPEPVLVAAPAPSTRKSGRGRPAAAAKDRASKHSAAHDAANSASVGATETTTTKVTRQSSRRKPSVDASQIEPAQIKLPKRTTRQAARLSEDPVAEEEPPQPPPQANGTGRSNGRKKEKQAPPARSRVVESPVHEESVESATIALPMSDTPIINRNKEMRRKGGTANRRSSLGTRGRRASSLIESGQAAIPHKEVNPSEFYKHIAESLPEPRRMKQLLMWCGERALAAKPRHGNSNSGAILGARAIQDQILKDFALRSEFSDWFARDEDNEPKAPVPVILKPNPRNIELDEKITGLEAKIQRLQEEKKAWLAIRKPPPEQPPLFTPEEAEKIILPDFDLLDPEEGQIRGFLADEFNTFAAIRTQTEQRLRRIQSSLEFEVDQLADNVHKLEQRVRVAGKEADKVLSLSSLRLRERDEREKRQDGTKDMPIMEVLRSLSSILPEGGG